MNNVLLETQNLGISFGGLQAVKDFNFKMKPNELVGLIGPNGAGKTTVFNLLSGVYTPTNGNILLDGEVLNKKRPDQIVQRGMVRTFQNIRLFDYMTVLDNVVAAYNFNMDYGIFQGALRMKSFWKEEKEARDYALQLLSIFNLEHLKDTRASNLPYGEQRKLEIVRALATDPKILLLDEPAAGMNPRETEELMETIRNIRESSDIGILLIEHDMKLVLGICERLLVLDYGKIIAEGDPKNVVNDPKVITAYLGAEALGSRES